MAWVWGSVPIRADARPRPHRALGGDPSWGVVGKVAGRAPFQRNLRWSLQDLLRVWDGGPGEAGAGRVQPGRSLWDVGIWGLAAVGRAKWPQAE